MHGSGAEMDWTEDPDRGVCRSEYRDSSGSFLIENADAAPPRPRHLPGRAVRALRQINASAQAAVQSPPTHYVRKRLPRHQANIKTPGGASRKRPAGLAFCLSGVSRPKSLQARARRAFLYLVNRRIPVTACYALPFNRAIPFASPCSSHSSGSSPKALSSGKSFCQSSITLMNASFLKHVRRTKDFLNGMPA